MEEVPRRLGSYEVQAVLGKGGMGQVLKAIQPSLNRTVAIKVLPEKFAKDPKEAERFHREAQAVAMISHPNVVQIIDKDQEGEALYFVMEYVEGDSLAQLLRKRRLTLGEALDIFKQICAGLEAAHDKEIVHRDLNPRNVLVSEDLSIVKLADFGISRVKSVSQTLGTLSTTRFTMGTLPYMSPEQLASMAEVDHRADIYSAGALLYEMLTGVVPLGEFTPPSQLNEDLAPEVDGLVLKCLAGEPDDRYQTVADLLEATERVEHFFGEGSVSESQEIPAAFATKLLETSTSPAAEPASQPPPAARPRRSGMLPWVAGALAFLVVAGGAGFWLLRPHPAPDPPVERGAAVEVPTAPRFGEQPGADAPSGLWLPEELEIPGTVEARDAAAEAARQAAEERARAAERETREALETAPESRPAEPRRAAPPEPDLGPIERKVADAQLEAALTDLERFVADNADSSKLPAAYLLIAKIHRQLAAPDRAREALTVVDRRFGASPEAAEALFLQGQLALESKRRGSALEALQLFDQVEKRFPGSPHAPPALAAKAAIETDEKLEIQDSALGRRVPAALVSYRALAQSYPSHALAEEAFWQLGRLYASLDRFDLAAPAYEELGRRFANTGYDAWWEAGQLYERKLDDEEKARAAYERVPETSRSYGKAQRRLRKLGA